MIEVFWRYRIHVSQKRAFEHAYGSTGPWAALFGRHPGYRRTRLFRHKDDPGIYLTVDVWDSKADWDAFRSEFADDYLRLDRQLAMLKMEEHLLGYYDGTDEYQPPIDAMA
jgi:heme-degrading monooxygenase HmoA